MELADGTLERMVSACELTSAVEAWVLMMIEAHGVMYPDLQEFLEGLRALLKDAEYKRRKKEKPA